MTHRCAPRSTAGSSGARGRASSENDNQSGPPRGTSTTRSSAAFPHVNGDKKLVVPSAATRAARESVGNPVPQSNHEEKRRDFAPPLSGNAINTACGSTSVREDGACVNDAPTMAPGGGAV